MRKTEDLFYMAVEHLGGKRLALLREIKEEESIEKPVVKCIQSLIFRLGVSNHHVHLSQADADILFGKGYNFSESKNLITKRRFAYKECLILAGPKGVAERVRGLRS